MADRLTIIDGSRVVRSCWVVFGTLQSLIICEGHPSPKIPALSIFEIPVKPFRTKLHQRVQKHNIDGVNIQSSYQRINHSLPWLFNYVAVLYRVWSSWHFVSLYVDSLASSSVRKLKKVSLKVAEALLCMLQKTSFSESWFVLRLL